MNQAQFDNKWIGRGIKLPSPINGLSGGINTNTGVDRIMQSIYQILSTTPGERFMLPDFGSKLFLCIFEPNDFILKDLIQVYTKEALARWEPRITVISVTANVINGDNVVPVSINFRIKATNMVNNYVYPFQRQAMSLGGDVR